MKDNVPVKPWSLKSFRGEKWQLQNCILEPATLATQYWRISITFKGIPNREKIFHCRSQYFIVNIENTHSHTPNFNWGRTDTVKTSFRIYYGERLLGLPKWIYILFFKTLSIYIWIYEFKFIIFHCREPIKPTPKCSPSSMDWWEMV